MNFITFYVLALFITSSILIIWYLFRNKDISYLTGKYYAYILVLIALTFLFKIPYTLHFFYGLEYEDSYLVNSVARFLSFNKDQLESPFLARTCGIGSLLNCEISFTHSGNLMGLPSIIWALNELFGYNINTVSMFNFWCALISVLVIFFLCLQISNNPNFGLSAALVYIVTPILNSFHTSSLFETFSGTLILLSLFLYILYFESPKRERSILNRRILLVALILITLFSIHVKRENIIVLLFPFISIVVHFFRRDYQLLTRIKELGPYIIFLGVILLYYIYVLNVRKSISIESEYAIGYPFQFKFFIPLFKMFIMGFSNLKWFYFFGILIVCGLIFISIDLKRKPLLLFPFLLFCAFILINSVHHRSYYFVRSGLVSDFDSLRHINLLSPFYAIICGYALSIIIGYIRNIINRVVRIKSAVFITISLLLIAHLLYLTYTVRNELIEIETYERISPIKSTLELIDQSNDILITDQSVLVQNYCDPRLRIIEFSALGTYIHVGEIESLLSGSRIFFLRRSYFNEKVFQERYLQSFETLENLSFSVISTQENYQLLQLTH